MMPRSSAAASPRVPRRATFTQGLRVVARLPQIHLPALLIEVDRDTQFSEAFTHAGGAQPRNPDLIRNLYASILAYACNLGYAGMADASGISEDTLAWTSQWYLRQDTLREANARLVNAHHRHSLAQLWGGGTLSSSDGQRFPQRGRSLTARALSRYFLGEGTTTYTHVSDQHSTYGTKVIPTTWREAVAVLDEIFGNPTDLAIAEHTTDTAGQTLATFGIFNLAGLQFSPRIRDIGRLQLYRLGPGSAWRGGYPHAGPLLTQPIQTQLIADHWNDLLRLVGSMKFGHTTASLLIAKLHASSRQNSLARAIRPAGAHHLPLPLRRRRRTPPPGPSAAEQGREPARAAPRSVLRPPRTRP
jgi:TnpA family transposase